MDDNAKGFLKPKKACAVNKSTKWPNTDHWPNSNTDKPDNFTQGFLKLRKACAVHKYQMA